MDGVNYYYDGTIKEFHIKENTRFFIINQKVDELIFNIDDNKYLEIINFCEIDNDTKIVINEYNNTNVKYVSNVDVKGHYNLNIQLNMFGNNSFSNIMISGVVSNDASFFVESFDKEKTFDNEIAESIRLLNDNGKIHVEPILRVGSMHVLANHSNSITDYNEDYLFYLKTKGIDQVNASRLIKDSYKYGLIRNYDEVMKFIKE